MPNKPTPHLNEPASPIKKLTAPIDKEKLSGLKAGEFVLLGGVILGARDAAHKRIISAIKNNEDLPVNLDKQVIFYTGPSPVQPGKKSGAVGPTTGARMDDLTEALLKKGISATIGKGARSGKLKELLIKHRAVYFIAPGGVAAYLAQKVKKIDVAAYEDLGPEAIFKIEVEDFPLFVAYDIYGGDIFDFKSGNIK